MMTEDEQIEMAIRASMGTNSTKVDTDDELSEDVVIVKEVKIDDTPVGSNFNWPGFKRIPLDLIEETSAPASDMTRVQIRFPDGQRLVLKLLKNDKVIRLFGHIKASYPDKAEQPFDVTLIN